MSLKPPQLTYVVAIALAMIAACGSVSGLRNDSGAATDGAGTGGQPAGNTDGGTGTGGVTGGGGTTGGGAGGATGMGGAAAGIRVRGAIGAARPSAPPAGGAFMVLNPRLGAPAPSSCGPAVCLVRGGIGP